MRVARCDDPALAARPLTLLVPLHAGIHLVPNLGVSRWPLGNQRVKRNILISEYIVRQTGVYRSSRQVSGHLNAIRRSKRKLSKGCASLLSPSYS